MRRSTVSLADHVGPLGSRFIANHWRTVNSSRSLRRVSAPSRCRTPSRLRPQITVPTVLFGFSPTVFTAVDVEIGGALRIESVPDQLLGGGSSSAFTFNEGLVFSSSFGGSEIFSLFSSSTSNDGQLGFETGTGSIGTSGNGSVGGGNASSIASSTSTTTSITPLNPSSTSGKGSSSGAPVVVVTISVTLVSVHLGASRRRLPCSRPRRYSQPRIICQPH